MLIDFETYRWDSQNCIRCTNCKWVDFIWLASHRFSKICPSSAKYLFDAYAANGRLDIAIALADGRLDYSPKLLEEIYACTLCGACDVKCKRNVELEPMLILEWLRQKAVEDGQGPMPEHKSIAESIAKSKNRYGAPNENRFKWMPQDVQPAGKAEVLYFAGCNSAYRQPEIAQATVKLLKAGGSEFMVLGDDEWCCGNPLYSTGQVEAAREMAEHNLKAIQQSGAKTVVASCAECYQTLKVTYPKLLGKSTNELGFEVLHITEYLDQQLEKGALKLSNPVDLKITYQDPCNLGRLSEPWIHWEGKRGKYGVYDPPRERRKGTYGVYDPPRNLLQAIPGVELVEMERRKDQAWCCGAGGGVRDAFKDFALWTAQERLEEVKQTTGAEALISACPYCKENLSEAARAGGEKTQIYDITEILLQAIAPEGKEAG